jgi:hypothetical protein
LTPPPPKIKKTSKKQTKQKTKQNRTKQKQTKNKSHLGAVSPQRLVLQLLTQSGV